MISTPTPAERLRAVLARTKVDRPPAVCTGGMMNAAIVEVMLRSGVRLPEAHHDPGMMAELAQAVQAYTGFENLGVPFCMTVEAEALGSAIDFGTLACEPKVASERWTSTTAVPAFDGAALAAHPRIAVIEAAVRRLAAQRPETPVIASLTGPVSTAASVVDPMTFLKELRRRPDDCHALLSRVTDLLATFAARLVDAGAGVIAIGDPTATGEILGPGPFEDFAVRWINELTDRIHARGTPVIVHICGKLHRVRPLVGRFRADAFSTDALVSLPSLKLEHPELVAMGNVSTYLLQDGTPDRVASRARYLIDQGVDIIAPACGLSTASPVANIRALTDTVRRPDAVKPATTESDEPEAPGQPSGAA